MTDSGTESAVAQALYIAPFRVTPLGGGMVRIEWDRLEAIRSGQVWRLVTPIFLHFSPWHLLFNMGWLWVLGGQIEVRRGTVRLALMVLVIAVGSNLLQYYFGHLEWDRPSPTFGGMSGVVYGLFGYVWMKARFDPELELWVTPSNIILMMGWFVLCWTPWFQTLVGPVANMAHLGGLVAGALMGVAPLLVRPLWRRRRAD
jgi:GlpG protein